MNTFRQIVRLLSLAVSVVGEVMRKLAGDKAREKAEAARRDPYNHGKKKFSEDRPEQPDKD